MSLKVGPREFIGEGATRQAARHNAAEKALKVLMTLPIPDKLDQGTVETPQAGAGGFSADSCSDFSSENRKKFSLMAKMLFPNMFLTPIPVQGPY